MKLIFKLLFTPIILFQFISSSQLFLKGTSIKNYFEQSDTPITFFSDSLKTNSFLLYGIVNHQTLEMVQFKEKYGVGFQFQTCVVSPASYKKTSQNNQNTAIYLSNKYGNSWVTELPVLPIGIKK